MHAVRSETSSDRDAAASRLLAGQLLALGSLPSGGRTFAGGALCFAAVLWAELARGGFFTRDLAVFVVLAVSAMAVCGGWRVLVGSAWWLVWMAAAVAAAVLVSAVANHQLSDAKFPIGAVIAALALGAVGAWSAASTDRLVVRRVVVDVTCMTAALCVVGVALHLTRFAQLQAEGWRAAANLGYANVAALFMVLGLLCACAAAAQSGEVSDYLRCSLLALGVLTTQARSAVVCAVLCWVIFALTNRRMARALASASAWALVAFVGVLPSVQDAHAKPLPVALGLAIAAALVVTTAPIATRARLLLQVLLGGAAGSVVLTLLYTRVNDGGSNEGRLRLWHSAVHDLHQTGWLGAGPGPLANFTQGHVTELFAHNDYLQYAEYYGLPGAAAIVFVAFQCGRVLWRSRDQRRGIEWPLAVTVIAATGFVALVDFPLQVPLITGTAVLVIATTSIAGLSGDRSGNRSSHQETVRSNGGGKQ